MDGENLEVKFNGSRLTVTLNSDRSQWWTVVSLEWGRLRREGRWKLEVGAL